MSSKGAVTRVDRLSWGDITVRQALTGLAKLMLAAFIFFACFAFSDTSPYDVIAIPTILLWLALGIRLHRGAVPLVWLLLVYLTAIVVALIPYLDESLSTAWTIQLCYLAVTGVFFAMLFSEDSQARVELALKAYVASCVFSAILGIIGYLQILGIDDLFSRYGRASGTFQDPNVFGSFLCLGALYLMHGLMTGCTRRPVVALAALLVILAGIFLSFSRGSWGACVLASATMVGAIVVTSDSTRLRRRIVLVSAVTVVLAVVALLGLLSLDGVAETFRNRASATQDYDEGETGRFGNQLRGMAMLTEMPFGMGPLRWRRIFELEPHNSYIGSFANGGWIGGVAFILIVAATAFVAFRLMARDTPYRRHAQIVWPALMVFFIQAVQIDVEKWRHVYMMMGMIWGLEAARLRWASGRALEPVATAPLRANCTVFDARHRAAGAA